MKRTKLIRFLILLSLLFFIGACTAGMQDATQSRAKNQYMKVDEDPLKESIETDNMRNSIWHIDFTEVDGKPKQTTSIAYIERKGTPNIGGAGAVLAPNSSWFAVVEVHNKEMALVLKSSDKAVQQKELFKAPKGDRLVAWPAWSPSGDQIAIIHVQLDKQRRRFSYNIIIADINGANISRHMLPEGTLRAIFPKKTCSLDNPI